MRGDIRQCLQGVPMRRHIPTRDGVQSRGGEQREDGFFAAGRWLNGLLFVAMQDYFLWQCDPYKTVSIYPKCLPSPPPPVDKVLRPDDSTLTSERNFGRGWDSAVWNGHHRDAESSGSGDDLRLVVDGR